MYLDSLCEPIISRLAAAFSCNVSPLSMLVVWAQGGAYATGVLVFALWSLAGYVAVKRLLASAWPAPPQCRILLRSVGGAPSERVALVVSARAAQPCAVWWRPTTISACCAPWTWA